MVERIRPCHKSSMVTLDLINCVSNKMEGTSSYFLDDHLVPQSYELYIGIFGYYDIGVQVQGIDLSLLKFVLEQLG
jgi:hypothetical protein